MNAWTKATVQGAACGLMMGAVLLIGGYVWRPAAVAAQAPGVADVVRARSFVVVDEAGRMRAVLGVNQKGDPRLDLLDVNGHMQVTLSLNAVGCGTEDDSKWPNPGLVLFNGNSIERVRLCGGTPGGAAGLFLSTELDQAALFTDEDGKPFLLMFDHAWTPRLFLGLTDDWNPMLLMTDENFQWAGQQRWEGRLALGLKGTDGAPSFALRDQGAKLRAVLGAASLEGMKTGEERKRSESSLMLFDKDGKLMWEAP